jgi:hypothetical protein
MLAGGHLSAAFAGVNLSQSVKDSKSGKLAMIGKAYRPLTEIEMELARVKTEDATYVIEWEIL